MGRIVIELTNRCNLRCLHCYTGRHGGNEELSLAVFDKLLISAKSLGFSEFSFTGGEPTTHRQFFEIIKQTCKYGYEFGIVSNGWNFHKVYQELLPFKCSLKGITFSMDGANKDTHDRIRGEGSFQRLLKAMSICVARDLPFTVNMVLTALNYHEIDELIALAIPLGSAGVRFGHYIDSGRQNSKELQLNENERRRIEAKIFDLQAKATIPMAMAPGYYTTELFPCAPLNLEEINVDWQGNVGSCCHLSGISDADATDNIAGNLKQASLVKLVDSLKLKNEIFRRNKTLDYQSGKFLEEDFSPCKYCSKYYDPGSHVSIQLLNKTKVFV